MTIRSFRTLIVYLSTAAFLYFVFTTIAEFSIPQSVVLAILFAWVVREIEKPTWKFTPYYISVSPKWFDILTDFKLISNPEEWHAIIRAHEKLPFTEYRVLRQGIYLTVVDQSDDFERTLIYSYYDRDFVSEVDFEEDMEPIKIKRDGEIPMLSTYKVRFFMRFGSDGYNLGIIVPDWWWKQMKDSCPAPVEEENDHPTGQIKLTLATIPIREFDLYWSQSNFSDKTTKKILTRREEQRKKFGWKTVEHPDLPELAINWPETIEHKYFEVKHREI